MRVDFVNIFHNGSITFGVQEQAPANTPAHPASAMSWLTPENALMNKSFFLSFLVILLSSCVATPASSTPTDSPQTIPTFTAMSTPLVVLESTVTSLPPSPTATPSLCDPFTADFCITDGHFLLQRPIQPPANDSVDRTYPYASTADGTRDPHHGVEFQNSFGTLVHAAADGVVIFAGPDKEAVYSPWQNFYGNLVVIQHGDELSTLYAHLSKIDVETGEDVQVGGKIGEVGQSGAATGSHLHFEVRLGDVEDYFSTENPELWLKPNGADLGALTISILDETSQFQRAKITLQHYFAASSDVVGVYYLDTYDLRMANGEENAAINDLPSGRYRITLIHNSHLYERRVDVESGKLTQVVIVVE